MKLSATAWVARAAKRRQLGANQLLLEDGDQLVERSRVAGAWRERRRVLEGEVLALDDLELGRAGAAFLRKVKTKLVIATIGPGGRRARPSGCAR